MYSYEHDPETGGLILTPSPTNFSKEPRPVYAPELDMLGFSRFWRYSPQTDAPYMWAESNAYIYRGKKVAEIRGGDLYHAPEEILTPEGDAMTYELEPVDIDGMCRKNKTLLKTVERRAVKGIASVYHQFRDKADIFHVAFSGGKDSAVLLDLVKRTLPKKGFVVVFGDTGMEFPDTYEAVDEAERMCVREGIAFFRARSSFEPSESWRLFGPPSRTLRWCCSVHKSAPQTLKLREILRKDDYVGLDFVGVRRHESVSRSKYKVLNYGEKQKGQWSHNSILNWTSAEVWLYIYLHRLYVNEAYKKGNARVGCLLCPMTSGYALFSRRYNYMELVDGYVNIIEECYNADNPKEIESYVVKSGWNARKNGRDFRYNPARCVEDISNTSITMRVINPSSSWYEWMKTLGSLIKTGRGYVIDFLKDEICFDVAEIPEGYIVSVPSSALKVSPEFVKLFKRVFRKATYCIGCGACEMNCQRGCIKFKDGKLSIDGCIHCGQCHDVKEGCLMFASRRHPQGGGVNMKKSLNSFADHAPKNEWFESFFELKERFFTEHSLGPMMYDMFRRFLKDAGLQERNHFTDFAELVSTLGWKTPSSLGLMLVNLAYRNPQFEWYINNMDVNTTYERAKVEDMLTALDVKPKDAKSIVKAFKRIAATPFGTSLHFCYYGDDDTLTRNECVLNDNRVLLYALYVFAEKCSIGNEFSLAYLFDDTIERAGVSPVKIFGLQDDEQSSGIRARLMGLSATYPQFINATFTHDLQSITLMDKTPDEVLELFRKE